MKSGQFFISIMLLTGGLLSSAFADVITTTDGDEFIGKIVEVADDVVKYVPDRAASGETRTIARSKIFMLKYDDGRKEVFPVKQSGVVKPPENDNRLYSAYIFLETGLFGLVNINETDFDPGVFTLGVTPSIDRRINRFLSIGMEYMILWAKPNKANDSRFLMNCNALARASFPLHPKINFLAQLNAGLSIWPGAQSVHPVDSTFFMDRIGWDIHGGLGLEYKASRRGSLVLFAGYNANFSTKYETPVTIDMLMVSLGPKIRF